MMAVFCQIASPVSVCIYLRCLSLFRGSSWAPVVLLLGGAGGHFAAQQKKKKNCL